MRTGAAAGVMISASHNPVADNGIKFFSGDGFKLSDELELEIERAVDVRRFTQTRRAARSASFVRPSISAVTTSAELYEGVPSSRGPEGNR